MENHIGRWSEINGQDEVKNLTYGMDFRRPKYRREVFLRFYEFHLKYHAHPGAVYYILPFIFEKYKMTTEQKLWFTFLNGVTQNVVTTFIIWESFPDLEKVKLNALSDFFRKHYSKFGWDTDRRYVKNKFEEAVKSYLSLMYGRTQEEYFNQFMQSPIEYANFDSLWSEVMENFHLFGRLATFSYLEYLRIAGLPLDCGNLFLDDISGSKSHRNGLCKVLGRDDLDWYKNNNPDYNDQILKWLNYEADLLLGEARNRIDHKDVSYFTLESTLCCYKSWHRPNRRYPNVYNDMFYYRIKTAEENWGKKMPLFWEAREQYLPDYLRLECTPNDYGLKPIKMNFYRKTGQVIMMHNEWDCFGNDYNDYIERL